MAAKSATKSATRSATKSNASLTCAMMERLGIEPGAAVVPQLGLVYTTAFHRCDGCGAKEACLAWLSEMPQSVAFAPSFCPNADILFELQVAQSGLSIPRSASAKLATAK
jgi:hypothetical protein